MKSFILLITSFVFVACAPIYVTNDYEKTANFSAYKTYNFYFEKETGLSELDEKRLYAIIDTTLQEKGLQKADYPDFYIELTSKEYENIPNNTVGVGLGGSGRNIGGGITVGIPISNQKITRQITFNFIDENKLGLFWQSITESNYHLNWNPEKRESHLQNVVAKAFTNFPPKN